MPVGEVWNTQAVAISAAGKGGWAETPTFRDHGSGRAVTVRFSGSNGAPASCPLDEGGVTLR